jgi:hypothetical protein
LWSWANSPVNETETTTVDVPSSDALPDQTVTSSCYSFQVPGGFRVKDVTDPNNPAFAHTQIFETSNKGRQAGITCSTLPSEGLSGVASYNMREKRTDLYEPYFPADLPVDGKAFRDPKSGEVTVFLVDGKRYASISVTGVMGNNRLRDFASHIYTTWQWL